MLVVLFWSLKCYWGRVFRDDEVNNGEYSLICFYLILFQNGLGQVLKFDIFYEDILKIVRNRQLDVLVGSFGGIGDFIFRREVLEQ